MQNASRRPAQLCKADRAGAVHNNDDFVLTEEQALRNRHLKRIRDVEKQPPKNHRTSAKGCGYVK